MSFFKELTYLEDGEIIGDYFEENGTLTGIGENIKEVRRMNPDLTERERIDLNIQNSKRIKSEIGNMSFDTLVAVYLGGCLSCHRKQLTAVYFADGKSILLPPFKMQPCLDILFKKSNCDLSFVLLREAGGYYRGAPYRVTKVTSL